MASRKTVTTLVCTAALLGACGGSAAPESGPSVLREPEPVGDELATPPSVGASSKAVASTGARKRAAEAKRRRTQKRKSSDRKRNAGSPAKGADLNGTERGAPAAKLPPGVRVVGTPGHVPAPDAAKIDRVKDVVHGLAAGVSKGDPSVCTRLMTLHYVETITGLRGQAALAKCRLNMSRSHGRVVVERVDGVRLENASTALIQFVTSANGRSGGTQILRLVESGGAWRIDEALRASA